MWANNLKTTMAPLAAAVGLAVATLTCTPAAENKPARPAPGNSTVTAPVVQSNSDFALHLYAQLNKENGGKNLFVSPYSISSALLMVAEGARGETAEQMGKVLCFPEELRKEEASASPRPWETASMHQGMAALNEQLSGASSPMTADIREALAKLRKELATANQESEAKARQGDFNRAQAAQTHARDLAAKINKMQSEHGQFELSVANALWGEKTYPFKKTYLDAVNRYYRTGGLFPVDFRNDYEGARKEINGWVEKQTHDRIKDLIPADALDPEAQKRVRLVLTNAIYFKGAWEKVFKAEQTRKESFTLADGSKVQAPLMRQRLDVGRYAAFNGDGSFFATPARVPLGEVDSKKVYPDERGFALLEVPYKGDRLSMVLIVPRAADGLAGVEKQLTAAHLQGWIGKLQAREAEVYLPRFRLETKYTLNDTLKALGMARAFIDPRRADGAQFDGMSVSTDPMQKLYISLVLHKAFVDVNEEGTEAAAATTVMMFVPTSAAVNVPFIPVVRADRPFLFLIRDRQTGSVLFLGRVTNPTAGR
jgi:serine protease inhibitor